MGGRRKPPPPPMPLGLDGAHAGCPVVEVELPEAVIRRERDAAFGKALEQQVLKYAKSVLTAAGYEFKKPRRSTRRSKDRVGPTFVAHFADGAVTRTSIHTKLDQLDWERGRRMAVAAHQSRTRRAQPRPLPPEHPDHRAAYERWLALQWLPGEAPAILEAHFEQDGVVLERRAGKALA